MEIINLECQRQVVDDSLSSIERRVRLWQRAARRRRRRRHKAPASTVDPRLSLSTHSLRIRFTVVITISENYALQSVSPSSHIMLVGFTISKNPIIS